MANKFSRFFSGVMEAAWLAAVSLIPIFFNIYSSRIFEPDKISILRSLALLSLGSWLLKLLSEGKSNAKEGSRNVSIVSYLWHYPMVGPVFGLIIVYSLSTIFSVTPLISLLGSYQRLQGTYTTFSYLVIFFAIVFNMRTREQINRFITTIILASLPVSLYGLLQRYHIDPIPWGGNVSTRIAANLGNSIFVAAYLIMVFPLTASRMLMAFGDILSNNEEVTSNHKIVKQIIKATIYVFILALELIAIYMSGSRGPMLGLMAGTYLFILLLSIYWRKRILTYAIIVLALFGVAFLSVFNMNNGPLEALKKSPVIGRFGILLDPESNSALVRKYIWEGTVKLVSVHDPLKFPDGSSDRFNLLRPLLGYGPESMYVAYNQFYQPELGTVEKRNASPDRSHNETWDSIVITGIAGLLVYLLIFSSFFYFGLKWQGLISNRREKYSFLLCLVGGGLIGALVLILLKGIDYFGIGLPIGMIIGVVLYLTIYAIIYPDAAVNHFRNKNSILLIALFAAIIGHFLEINFGIAIVATRTLFWSFAALMIVCGYRLHSDELAPASTDDDAKNTLKETLVDRNKRKRLYTNSRSRTATSVRPLIGEQPKWVRISLINGLIIGIILATLGFDYMTNAGHSKSIISIIIDAFTRLPNKDNAVSLGILILILMTWLIGVLIFYVETNDQDSENDRNVFILTAGSSILIALIFWLLQSISLAVIAGFIPATRDEVLLQVKGIGFLLTKYYFFIFVVFIFMALFLPEEWPQRKLSKTNQVLFLTPVALIVLFSLVNISDLKVIQADITFKMADPFTKNNQWQVATYLYQQALKLAPKEDHYYLFLGRSYLEQAKITETTSDQDKLVGQAEADLKVAQKINPLNTDHTANLARLYSWWAGKATTQTDLAERGGKASDYYATALTLSPNNSTLWDEWAVLFIQVLGQPQEGLLRLQHALSLDDHYSFTQGLIGDYYLRIANSSEDPSVKINALETSASYYRTAVDVAKSTDTTTKATYLASLGNIYLILDGLRSPPSNHAQLKQDIEIIINSSKSGISKGEQWKVQEVISKMYKQFGDKANAQKYANLALIYAPDAVLSRIQDLLNQIDALP